MAKKTEKINKQKSEACQRYA